MCGLFGLIRHTGATPAQHAAASSTLHALGRLAMERGTDSSGIAVYDPKFTFTPDSDRRLNSRIGNYENGPFSIVKAPVPYSDLGSALPTGTEDLNVLVDSGRVVLGHTRWATQGAKADLANCSPMAVGHLIGTHNGDVSTTSVPRVGAGRGPLVGSTDTEVLFASVDARRGDRRKVVHALTATQGRIALAWMDVTREKRVYLARGALSPLALAWDVAGNLFWASNPGWFRTVTQDPQIDITFVKFLIVREGTLLTVDISDAQPVIADRRSFTPTCRARDERTADAIAWRGFAPQDADADKAQRNRKVAPAPKATAKPATTVTATRTGTGWVDQYVSDTASYMADRWATEPEVWDGDDTPTAMQDEAVDALLEWAETGENPTVLAELEKVSSIADAAAYARRYRFSSPDVVFEFRAQMRQWMSVNKAEAAYAASV